MTNALPQVIYYHNGKVYLEPVNTESLEGQLTITTFSSVATFDYYLEDDSLLSDKLVIDDIYSTVNELLQP